MRSCAVVLGALIVGQAAATHLHHRHVSFHQRRQIDVKRDVQNVDWSKVAYDLSGVNWSTVKYNLAGQSTPTLAPTSSVLAPKTSSQVQQQQPKVQQNAPVVSRSTPSPASSPSSTASGGASIYNDVSDDMYGVSTTANRIKSLVGQNSKTNNGQIWIGSDSQWKAKFSNAASDDAVLYCWSKSSGYTGPFVGSTQPLITVGLKAGQSITLSYAGNIGTACAPVFPDTRLLSGVGYIYQTWFEVTFPGGSGGTGAFDITRLPNMNGRSIVAQGSQCKSDLNTCVFKCTADVDHCTTGYDLFGCGSGSGGGGGYDTVMQGTGGGCTVNQSGETINVSLY